VSVGRAIDARFDEAVSVQSFSSNDTDDYADDAFEVDSPERRAEAAAPEPAPQPLAGILSLSPSKRAALAQQMAAEQVTQEAALTRAFQLEADGVTPPAGRDGLDREPEEPAGPLQPPQPRDGEADVDDEFDVLAETAICEHASPRELPLGSPADTPRTAAALSGVDELLANLSNQVAAGQAAVTTFAKNLEAPPAAAASPKRSTSIAPGLVGAISHGAEVRKAPSWPRSWTNFSLF
jgi:hypothetical protein